MKIHRIRFQSQLFSSSESPANTGQNCPVLKRQSILAKWCHADCHVSLCAVVGLFFISSAARSLIVGTNISFSFGRKQRVQKPRWQQNRNFAQSYTQPRTSTSLCLFFSTFFLLFNNTTRVVFRRSNITGITSLCELLLVVSSWPCVHRS